MAIPFPEYDTLDALALAALIGRGEVSVGEVREAALDRIRRRNPALNAVIWQPDSIHEPAVAGPFRGVPFLLKNMFVRAAGFPCTDGSRLIPADPCDQDGAFEHRLRRTGLSFLGLTNSPEFGCNATTEPRRYGPTRNPWNPTRSAGGSSGGAAAAVAARMVPVAHASDGGGSIRIPASFCGLFGLNPTRARMPRAPGTLGLGISRDHVVSRSVRDSAALLDAVAGDEIGAAFVAPPLPGSLLAATRRPPGRLRIGVTHAIAGADPVDPACTAAVDALAGLCAGLGHEVEGFEFLLDMAGLRDAMARRIAAGFANDFQECAAASGRWPRADEVEPVNLAMAELGRGVTGAEILAGERLLQRFGRTVCEQTARFDIVLMPVTASPAPPLGWLSTDIGVEEFWERLCPFTDYCRIFNISGQPSASVPVAWDGAGVPVGVQLVGRFGDETTIVALAAQIEAAQPWAAKRPDLSVE
ncbi:MAG TPA: amidase [Azospirillaceae bacterium]|nr:amidase [Azospirillaceae bacterium]